MTDQTDNAPSPTTCATCRYAWRGTPSNPRKSPWWECRRNPPVPVPGVWGGYVGTFPTTGPGIWCGHHELRQ